MPAFVYALLVGFASVVSSVAFQVLIALGIGFVTFTGISVGLTSLHDFAVSQWTALPVAVLQVLGLVKVDQALNLIISAAAARFTLQGLTGGGIRKLVWKAGS